MRQCDICESDALRGDMGSRIVGSGCGWLLGVAGPAHPLIERVAVNATDSGRLSELVAGAAALYSCANPLSPVAYGLAAVGLPYAALWRQRIWMRRCGGFLSSGRRRAAGKNRPGCGRL